MRSALSKPIKMNFRRLVALMVLLVCDRESFFISYSLLLIKNIRKRHAGVECSIQIGLFAELFFNLYLYTYNNFYKYKVYLSVSLTSIGLLLPCACTRVVDGSTQH